MDFINVGKKIKTKRVALSLNQAQLAENVDLSTDYISKLERGERIPKLPSFVKILNALDLSADEVLSEHVGKSYVSRMSNYIDRIGTLPVNEQNRIYKLLDAYLDKM